MKRQAIWFLIPVLVLALCLQAGTGAASDLEIIEVIEVVYTRAPATAVPLSPPPMTPSPTPSATPVSTAVPTKAPTPTPEPSPTPEPTLTPEPTATPSPTPTPEPTPTPTPTPEPTPEIIIPIPDNPESLPDVIDKINKPDQLQDFQFPQDGTKLLEIWIADIRDADATLILYDRQAWMIDCGDEKMGDRTAAMLKQLGVTRIAKMFNSHPHHDHLLGLPAIRAAARVEELLICFPEDSTEHMVNMMDFCREHDIPVSMYGHGDEFLMGDGKVRLTFWQNPENLELNMNNRSAATKITYGDRSILLLADIEFAGQKALMDLVGAETLDTDLVKYPHHGKLPMKELFFEAMSPAAAIITNYQGGAHDSSYFLGLKRCPQIFTNKAGLYTHLVTDGKRWMCEYVPIEE